MGGIFSSPSAPPPIVMPAAPRVNPRDMFKAQQLAAARSEAERLRRRKGAMSTWLTKNQTIDEDTKKAELLGG